MIRRLSTIACIALFAFAAVASAATTKSKSKTVSIDAGAFKVVVVAYPDALKFGGAKYSGKVKVLSGKVSILSKGSAQGGSVFSTRLQNTGSGKASVKVTATTVEP